MQVPDQRTIRGGETNYRDNGRRSSKDSRAATGGIRLTVWKRSVTLAVMVAIERLLHRRSDLSTVLVHLTRDGDSASRERLLRILGSRRIEARTALGMAKEQDAHLQGSAASQRVVCFSETPLEHTWMMTEQIDGRTMQFGSYGLVFTKTTARRMGCNPVWYLDITPGHDWLTGPINDLVRAAVAAATDRASGQLDTAVLAGQSILKVTPFLEQMGPTNTSKKEFWWEREWRHVGDFAFMGSHVVALLAPENDHDALGQEVSAIGGSWARRLPPILDPIWGLERMIGAMSGIDEDQLGPFPEA